MNTIHKITFLILCTFFFACDKSVETIEQTTFSTQDDIRLGQHLANTIEENTINYPVLDAVEYAAVYTYVNDIKNVLLTSNELQYRTTFDWKIVLLNNDEIEHAFSLPGGRIYISTGLLKGLKNDNQLLNVLANEMAYSDSRLVVPHLENEFILPIILDVTLGNNPEKAVELVHYLSSEAYSSNLVKTADEKALKMVCSLGYSPIGLVEVLEGDLMRDISMDWLLLHPNSQNRINNIEAVLLTLDCSENASSGDAYDNFLTLMPE